MNWITKAKALPQPSDILIPSDVAGEISWAPTLPDPKNIPVKLALEALTAQGIMIKQVSQTTSYSYDGVEFDLSMTIQIMPDTGKETLNSLNEWFFKSKGW